MNRYLRPQPSAVAIHAAIAQRSTTAEAVMHEAASRIAELEPMLHAWKFLDTSAALRQAHALDARIAAGENVGLLSGVPLAVKDIIDTTQMPTGYGSAVYAQYQPAADADVVRSVRQAGAVIVGKTVTTEFAYFTPGPTANPWHVGHTPGGSSSGSAAAVASGMVPLAFGSQTAGSLIRPASYCGVFALKPTHDLVSGTGVKPFAPSLDTVGWLSNSAEDLELMRAALQGEAYECLPDASGMRIASCHTHEWAASDASGHYAWEAAQRRLSKAGTRVTALDLPESLSSLLQAQKTVMAYEAALHLSHETSAHASLVSQHIHDLVSTGKAVRRADYEQAKKLAATGLKQVLDLMGDGDALLVPAAPGEAPAGLAATGDPVFSRVWTLLGMPCASVPGLFGLTGMPVGMQLVGRPFQERRLLACAATLHSALLGNTGH